MDRGGKKIRNKNKQKPFKAKLSTNLFNWFLAPILQKAIPKPLQRQ
jgi:hypothetical protein